MYTNNFQGKRNHPLIRLIFFHKCAKHTVIKSPTLSLILFWDSLVPTLYPRQLCIQLLFCLLHIMLSKKGSTSISEMETIERKRNIRPAVFTYFLTHLQIYTRAQKKSNVIFEANIFARLNASTLA